MSKAGVLSGTVTTNAPADGAPTTKRKGKHWFEYGDGGGPPSLSTLRDGLISWWSMDKEVGYWQDVHALNNCDDVNTVTQAVGIVGNAGQFTFANDEYLLRTLPHTLTTNGNDFTCALHVYIDALQSEHMYLMGIMFGVVASGEWALGINSVGQPFFQIIEDDGALSYKQATGPVLDLAVWYHLLGEYDSVNGVISITVNTDAPSTLGGIGGINVQTGAALFKLGDWSQDTPSRQFDGRLDEPAAWARLLTSAEKIERSGGAAYPDQALGTFPVIQGQEYSVDDGIDIIARPPEFIVSGDRLLLICIAQGANVFTSTPAGWTLIDRIDGNDTEIAAFSKIADGTEVAFNFVSPSANKGIWWLRINNAGDIDVSGFEIHSNNTTHIAAEITTTVPNCLAIYAMAFDGGDGQPFGLSGTDWTEVEQQDFRVTGASTVAGSFGKKDVPAAGLTGDATLTAAVSDDACTLQISIKPA